MATSSEATASWLELLGCNDWKGLLYPLDHGLRRLILRCGDFCQATYDAFNNDDNSKYAGSSRYGKNSFFDKVMLKSALDYQIVCFLYATAKVGIAEAVFLHSLSHESWDRESNWIGYVATTTDTATRALGRREIYVVWRGTTRNYEWINNVFGARLESAAQLLRAGCEDQDDDHVPKVMNGWLAIYVSTNENSSFTKLSARSQLQRKIRELREIYKNDQLSITLTGHSLGACLAILSAFDLVENGVTDIPVTAVVFGSPQVGDNAFRERVQQFPNLKILRVKNKTDLIPHYPSAILGYSDVGVELEINNKKSPMNPSDWHNLQGMLYAVAGWNREEEEEEEFELKEERSLALVNKSSEYLINPDSWWMEKNRVVVRDHENGEWISAPPADEDHPVSEFS